MLELGVSGAELIARIESVPFSRWHTKARIIVGSATFFDAFDALSLAFALSVSFAYGASPPLKAGSSSAPATLDNSPARCSSPGSPKSTAESGVQRAQLR